MPVLIYLKYILTFHQKYTYDCSQVSFLPASAGFFIDGLLPARVISENYKFCNSTMIKLRLLLFEITLANQDNAEKLSISSHKNSGWAKGEYFTS